MREEGGDEGGGDEGTRVGGVESARPLKFFLISTP